MTGGQHGCAAGGGDQGMKSDTYEHGHGMK